MWPIAAELDISRRLKAARAYAGLSSAEALADRIGEPGLGVKVLRKFEQAKGAPTPRDLDAIAKACGLPVAWFLVDFSRLPEIAPRDSRGELQRLTDEAREQFRKRREGSPGAARSRRPGDPGP